MGVVIEDNLWVSWKILSRLAAGLLSLRRKSQTFVIFAGNVPMITNYVFVKLSLDIYGLAAPWPLIITSLVIASAFIICNEDGEFK